MEVVTKKQMERRKAYFLKQEEEKVNKLIAKYKKTGNLAIASLLYNRYGIGDFSTDEFSIKN